MSSIFSPYRDEVAQALVAGSPLLLTVEPGFPWRELNPNSDALWSLVLPKESGSAHVAEVRDGIQAVARGYVSEVWVYLHSMNSVAQNALLKFLEDDSHATPTVLIVHPDSDVLVTVSSRCFRHVLSPPSDDIYRYALGASDKNLPRPWYGTLAEAKVVADGDMSRVSEIFRALSSLEPVATFRAIQGVSRDDAILLSVLVRRHVLRLAVVPELDSIHPRILSAWSRALALDPSPRSVRWGALVALSA